MCVICEFTPDYMQRQSGVASPSFPADVLGTLIKQICSARMYLPSLEMMIVCGADINM